MEASIRARGIANHFHRIFLCAGCRLDSSNGEQNLDGAPLVHGAVAFGDVGERQLQVEHLPGLILPLSTRSIRCGRKRRTGAGPPSMPVCEKNSGWPSKRDAVRHADITDQPPGRAQRDRLRHRLLRADAFQHGVGADAACQLLDAGDALVAALGDDVGRAVLQREILAASCGGSWR